MQLLRLGVWNGWAHWKSHNLWDVKDVEEIKGRAKNLVLKATKETFRVEDEETTYIAKRVLKALRKSRALPRIGESCKHYK